MSLKKKVNFKLYGVIIMVGAIVILSISTANYQKQSDLLREEIFDKCKMIATELKHVREYLAETIAISNIEDHDEARGFMPAMAGNEIGRKFFNETGYQLRQVSLKYRNPNNKPDKFEERALLKFGENMDLKEYKGVDKMNGQNVLRYLIPLYVEDACLKCHSAEETVPEFIQERYPEDKATGYKRGDLRGAISVAVPIDKAESEIKNHLVHMSFITAIGTVFLVAFVVATMNITVRKVNKEIQK